MQTAIELISAAETFEEAIACVIREVCVQSGWVAGEMWIPDASYARLELAPGWWAASPEMEAFFVEASAPQTMGPGEGLPGLVWQTRAAAWVDVTTTKREGPRIDTARRVGFAAGVAMPVLALIFSAVGILGAYVVAVLLIGVDAGNFWSIMQDRVDVWRDLGNGIVKSMVFGVLCTYIALYQGYESQPTPAGVSAATTRSVVIASLAVLSMDFILTALMFSTP